MNFMPKCQKRMFFMPYLQFLWFLMIFMPIVNLKDFNIFKTAWKTLSLLTFLRTDLSLNLTFQKICFYLLQWKAFKKDEKYFLFHVLKTLLVLEIFTFWSWLFGYIEKRLNNKTMVNFKIYVSDWTSNSYNAHIAKYPKK